MPVVRQKVRKQLIKNVKRKQSISSEDKPVAKRDHEERIHQVTESESLLFNQKGVRLQELSQLKQSNFELEDLLDLHGMTENYAEAQITEFIARNYAANKRYLRIIHGKGYNSNEPFPILKNLTNQVLRKSSAVVAFTSAPQKDGGVGAVNILLSAH